MIKRFSLYKLVIFMFIFTLFLPSFTSAEPQDAVTGSLTIHKYEQDPGSRQIDGTGNKGENPVGEPLAEVEFTITQTHSYDPFRDTWEKVSGKLKTYVTDENGKIEINPIELGRYKVQETNGPKHVVLNKKPYFVDVPMTSSDGKEVNYDVHIYPKNEKFYGKVTLKKYGGKKKKGLRGVTFNLYDEDNDELVQKNLTTGKHGKIVVDHLPYGNYYFKEVKTADGYLLNGEKVKFSIDQQGAKKFVSLNNYKEPEVEKSVGKEAVNRGETVTYEITLQLPEDIQSYEYFNVNDTLHDDLQYVSNSASVPTGFSFNQDGQTLTWKGNPSNLQPGKVTITFDAIVKKDAKANEPIENEAEIDYDNSYVTGSDKTPPVTVIPTAGSLKVIKRDGNDQNIKLTGAEFELRNEVDEVVATGVSGIDGGVDFGGKTDELNYGTYKLIETKAPEGYNKLRNPIEVSIDANNTEVTLKVDNYKSGWELPKTGGSGTLLFTVIGLSLMSTATWMYMRKRHSEEA